MIDVKIDENYKITSDTHNFVIEKYYPKAKKVKWKAIKWYPNIDGLMWGIFNHEIRISSATSLQELAQCVKKAKEKIDTIRAAVDGTTHI